MGSRRSLQSDLAVIALVAALCYSGHATAAATGARAAGYGRHLAQEVVGASLPNSTTRGAAAVQPPLTLEPNSTEAATSSMQAQNADTSGTLLAPLGVLHNETAQLTSDGTAGSNSSAGNVVASDPLDYANLTTRLPTVEDNNATRTNVENAVPLARCPPGQIAVASQCVTANVTARGRMGMSQDTVVPGGAGSPTAGRAAGANSAFAVKGDGANAALQWAMPLMLLALVLAAAPIHVMW